MRTVGAAEALSELLRRAAREPVCNLATIDRQGRVRSRLVHPLWEDGVGWILTRRGSTKVRHIRKHASVSLAYVADRAHTVYAECAAGVIDDPDEKRRVWELFHGSPVGYDPAPWYGSADDADLLLLRLIPWRIQLDDTPGESAAWESAGNAEHGDDAVR